MSTFVSFIFLTSLMCAQQTMRECTYAFQAEFLVVKYMMCTQSQLVD